MEYRGIQLDNNVRLYQKDGFFFKRVKNTLDLLVDKLEERQYTLLGEYVKNGEYINAKCSKDHLFKLKPSKFLYRGDGCKKCNGHCPDQAREDFYQLAEKKGYKVLDSYVNALTRLNAICDKGHECTIVPNDFKFNHGCQECKKVIIAEKMSKEAKEDFISKLKENGHEWVFGEYKNNNSPVLIDYKCEHDLHWTTPSGYKKTIYGCPKCANMKSSEIKHKKTREKYVLLVESKGHELLNNRVKNEKYQLFLNFKCGHKPQWMDAKNYHFNNYGCYECGLISMSEKRSQEAREELSLLVKVNGHKLLTSYGKNNKEPVLVDYKCGHKPHWVSPNNYKGGEICPECSGRKSKGEKIIKEWLESHGIIYIPQFKFPSKNKRKAWKYDIFIPSEKLIIEVHGLQHYEYCYWHIKQGKTLEEEQENDRKKRNYAEWQGYRFIEVDYREAKPKLALERFLKAFNQRKPIKKKIEQLSLF